MYENNYHVYFCVEFFFHILFVLLLVCYHDYLNSVMINVYLYIFFKYLMYPMFYGAYIFKKLENHSLFR